MDIKLKGEDKVMAKLSNKVAVVTGASKGIGASIAKHLAAEGASVVVNYSSSAAGAKKVVDEIVAAVDNITRTLALELGTKARVISLAPGLTHTEGYRDLTHGDDGGFEKAAVDRTPLGRAGQPEDIAKIAAFLASDDAGWITGEVI